MNEPVPKPATPEKGDDAPAGANARKPRRPHHVYTLLVEVGRRSGDGLPAGASGAGLMCYASGVDEDEAVRETVAVLKSADMNVLEVTGYGSLEEREAEGHDMETDERELMARALAENSVVVAQTTVFREGEA